MKKILGIVLAGVFALAFLTGAFSVESQADTVPLCWKAGECNYQNGLVYTCCQLPTGSGWHIKCWWDDQYFDLWCR